VKLHARFLALFYAITVLIGAFLVFQVQPIISKAILPWFGGSPAVWTTCLLFFQVVLFGGYAYAHVISRYLSPAWQGAVHCSLVALAVLLVPITPGAEWKPPDSSLPTARILLLLLVNVGLPYFLLSSTGPLMQAWYARSYGGKSPYRLYSLSNIGSLAALISYPFLVEPALSTQAQGWVWAVVFWVFAATCGFCAISLWRKPDVIADEPMADERNAVPATAPGPTPLTFFGWIALPVFASMMLMTMTNHVCQDVAVVPFLWVAPLSLYLISFIICFDNERWYKPLWYAIALSLSVLAVCGLMLAGENKNLLLDVSLYFATLFLICMVCHGELVRRKPVPKYLTHFYLACSAGGAMGGVTVALICPRIFTSYLELNLGLIAAYLLGVGVLANELGVLNPWKSSNTKDANENALLATGGGKTLASAACLILCAGGLVFVSWTQFEKQHGDVIAATRNFYGMLQVDESSEDDFDGLVLRHGRISHGFQFTDDDKRHLPTSYYEPHSGIGITMRRFAPNEPKHVGIIGLGVGTLAAYGEEGDRYRFYEINPDVIDLANEYFTFLSDCPAEVKTVLGDARLSLEREDPQQFDILVLDAFSSDAIPAHLLTREAFALYRRHLNPNGVIAVHISNRHVNLLPIVAGLAEHFEFDWRMTDTDGEGSIGGSSCDWVLVSNNKTLLGDPEVVAVTLLNPQYETIDLWTDDFNNLFAVLRHRDWSDFLPFLD
jgi:SAM-dependent methyltransferase